VRDPLIAASDERPFAFSEKGGYRAMKTLLDRNPRPDAVFAASDMQALGAVHAVQEQGLRVPEDLAIVGFDDIELSRCAGITTLRQPARTMGARAARTLLRRIDDANSAPVSSTVFSPKLVVRKRAAAILSRRTRPPGSRGGSHEGEDDKCVVLRSFILM
jgi:transcriptional regulator, LacI family